MSCSGPTNSITKVGSSLDSVKAPKTSIFDPSKRVVNSISFLSIFLSHFYIDTWDIEWKPSKKLILMVNLIMDNFSNEPELISIKIIGIINIK